MDMNELLEQFLTHLRVTRNASPYTIKNYSNDIGQFLDYCRTKGVGSLEQVDRSLLRGYLAELDAVGYVKASIARRVAELRSFGDFLVREGVLERNTFRTVSAPRVPKRLPHYLTVAEVEALLAVPDTSTPRGLRDRAIIEVLVGATGGAGIAGVFEGGASGVAGAAANQRAVAQPPRWSPDDARGGADIE